MPEKYRVQWTSTAEKDLLQFIASIVSDSQKKALQIFKKMRRIVQTLSDFPERCRVVPELQDQGVQIYLECIVSPWRIIFRVADEVVYVLAVIDGRRNLEDILLERLTDIRRQ